MSGLPQVPDGFRKQQRNGVTKISWRFDRNWFHVLATILGIVFVGFIIWKVVIPEILRKNSTDVELSQWEALRNSILTPELWSNNFGLETVVFSLFSLILLVHIYIVLVRLFNRSTLTFSQNTVTHTLGPLPYSRKRKLQISDIDRFYKEKFLRHRHRQRVRYALFARLHNNKRIKLVSVSYVRKTSHGIDLLVNELNAALEK